MTLNRNSKYVASLSQATCSGRLGELNKEIGNFETDQKSFEAGLRITVIEKDLLFNDVGNTVDYPSVPWRQGLYDIEIPDYSHRGGRNYLNQSKRAMTWFKIGHSGERYLHAGGRSLGCMTVIEVTRWMEIYNALIKTRKGDFMSVGVLEVIK